MEPGVYVVFTDPLATIEVFGMLADRDGCSNECKLVVDIAVRPWICSVFQLNILYIYVVRSSER